MATKDIDPDHPLPNDKAVISSRLVVASILVATATVTGISILSVGNPVTLFADATASLADKSAPQPSANQSTPIIQSVVIQSTANAEAVPPTAQDVPTREISASEPASQTKTEDSAASSSEASREALFREYQAWAAEQDARALAKPVQDDPAPVAEKQRRAGSVHNTRAEIRRVQERRAYVRQQNERVQARPVEDARAQAQSVLYARPPVQYAQPPSFLESLLGRPLY